MSGAFSRMFILPKQPFSEKINRLIAGHILLSCDFRVVPINGISTVLQRKGRKYYVGRFSSDCLKNQNPRDAISNYPPNP
jgi:hypothetical protein